MKKSKSGKPSKDYIGATDAAESERAKRLAARNDNKPMDDKVETARDNRDAESAQYQAVGTEVSDDRDVEKGVESNIVYEGETDVPGSPTLLSKARERAANTLLRRRSFYLKYPEGKTPGPERGPGGTQCREGPGAGAGSVPAARHRQRHR